MDIRSLIRDVPGFPASGVLFRDITPVLADPAAFAFVLDALATDARARGAEAIVGIESRGFLFGAPLADRLRLPFVPIRKPGKLPAARVSVEYALEYGSGQLDIHAGAFPAGGRAYIVDDVLATGGTALAAARLVEMVGGHVLGFGFVIRIDGLGGVARLGEYPHFTVVAYP